MNCNTAASEHHWCCCFKQNQVCLRNVAPRTAVSVRIADLDSPWLNGGATFLWGPEWWPPRRLSVSKTLKTKFYFIWDGGRSLWCNDVNDLEISPKTQLSPKSDNKWPWKIQKTQWDKATWRWRQRPKWCGGKLRKKGMRAFLKGSPSCPSGASPQWPFISDSSKALPPEGYTIFLNNSTCWGLSVQARPVRDIIYV